MDHTRQQTRSPGSLSPLTQAGYRLVQLGVKAGSYFLGYRMPECLTGPGSIGQLPALLREQRIRQVLLVTGPVILRLGLPQGLLRGLEEAQIGCTLFHGVDPNPTSENVEEGYRRYRDSACQGIIAFGGGGPMDCAKAIGARAARPDRSVAQLQGLLRVARPIPPLFAVPTTAGSGSETTVAAVIIDSATCRKASINDPALLPRYAVLDPELTLALPPAVTAATGLDALCHAVEAYTNHTYNTPLEDRLAKTAVRLIHRSLLPAYRDGSDLTARENMQLASFYAGRAFTRGCVGYVHAVGHTLGGLYGMPHGQAVGILLPHVMRQFGPAVHRPLAALAGEIGLPGRTEGARAEAFLSWLEELKAQLGLPVGVTGIREEDIPQIIRWALREANPLYPVPVLWGERELRNLLDTVRA